MDMDYKISSIISESSKTNKYLEQAYSENIASKQKSQVSSLVDIIKYYTTLSNNYNSFVDNVNEIYTLRTTGYETLASAMIGKYYSDQLLSQYYKLENANKVYNAINFESKNNELSNVLLDMTINTAINKTGNTILSSDGKKVYEVFNELKAPLGYPDSDIDFDGNIKGLENTYIIDAINGLSGTISFCYKENDSDDELIKYDGVIYDKDVLNSGKLYAKINMQTREDLVIENGTERYPYIIKSFSDIARTGADNKVRASGRYYKLVEDIEVPDDLSVFSLYGVSVNGDGHILNVKDARTVNLQVSGMKNMTVLFKTKITDSDRDSFTGGYNDIHVQINMNGSFPFVKYSENPLRFFMSLDETKKGYTDIYYDFILQQDVFASNGSEVIDNMKYSEGMIPVFSNVKNYAKVTTQTISPENGSLMYGKNPRWGGLISEILFFFGLSEEPNVLYIDTNMVTREKQEAKECIEFANSKAYPSPKSTSKYDVLEAGKIVYSSDVFKIVVYEDRENGKAYCYAYDANSSETISDEDISFAFLDSCEIDIGDYDKSESANKYAFRYSSNADGKIEFDIANHWIDNDGIKIYIPLKTNLSLNKLRESSNIDSLDAYTKLLYYLGKVSAAKNYSSSDIDLSSKTIRDDTLTLYDIIGTLRDDIKVDRDSLYNECMDYLKSYEYVENYRAEHDNNYTVDLLSNLMNIKSMVSDYLTSTSSSDVELNSAIDPEEIYNKARTYIKMMRQESYNLIVGLTQCLIDCNDYIDEYINMISDKAVYFDNNISRAAQVISEALTTNPNSGSFNFKTYYFTRDYSLWCNTFSEYVDASPALLSQIYLAQEIGMNSSGLSVNNVSDEAIVYKTYINDAVDRLYRSGALKANSQYEDSLRLERELMDRYGIFVTSDPEYEMLPVQITSVVPDLSLLNQVDITDMLIEVVDSRGTSAAGLIELCLIRYLFKDSVPKNIVDRYNSLYDIVESLSNDFKTLLVRYHLERIYLNMISVSNENTTSILYGLIDKDTNKISEKINVTAELLSKYITVWLHKYYSVYSSYGSALVYIDNEDFLKFLFNNNKESSYMIKEKKKTVTNYLNAIGEDLKNIFLSVLSWFI